MDDFEALLAHTRFVRTLARALVVDDARADDLVQQTWLAAIRRPPRQPERRAWLARVLRNAAITQQRSERRRDDRERRSARREGLPSAADIVEREELARRVGDAVFRLEEPYRRTILHRYYEDRPPREIARLEGVPVETVRTRLKRGLERLRRTLDRDFGGARTSWCVPLAAAWGEPLAAVPAASAGGAGGVGSMLALTKVPQLGGGLLMSGKLTTALISSAVVLAALGSGYLWVKLDSERELSAGVISQRDELAARVDDLTGQVAELDDELAAARRRREEIASQLAAAEKEREEAIAAALEEAGAGTNEGRQPTAPAGEPIVAELAEARSVAEELVRKGDLEGLWLLLVGLLAHGEEGYAKILELAAQLDGEDWQAMIESHLWSEEELYFGSFVATALAHQEGLLRFGLYLNRQDIGSLPPILAGMTQGFNRYSPMFLGSYRGDNAEILAGYLDLERQELEAYAKEERWPSEARVAIRALAQIHTDESTGYLIELLARVPAELKSVVVQSLSWQRTPKALETLRELDTAPLDRRTRGIVEASLRLLE